MILYKETEDYKISLEVEHCEEVDESVTFLHVDTYNMSKSILSELRSHLDELLNEIKEDVCFYSVLEESFRLASSIKPLDKILEAETEGTEFKIGIWEYK